MQNNRRSYNRLVLTLVVCCCGAFSLKAQFYNFPNDILFGARTEKVLASKDSSIHSGLQPYVPFFDKKYSHVPDSHVVFRFIKDDPAIELLFYKHFIQIEPKKENFRLRIDPLINIEAGRDLSDTVRSNLYTNSRGVIASGSVGDRFYFETMFSENQSVFPSYIRENVKGSLVVPGQGRWKNFKTTGYDYAFSSGFVSIQVLPKINLQVGHGKHKIGYGYRSLLLSDNAFNYPYIRVSQQWFKGRLQYTNLYTVFMNLVSASAYVNPNTERLFQKKCGSFQHLSINLGKSINLGLFQGLIWQAGNSRNRQQLQWQYFNPVIFSNMAFYGLNNRNNIVSGADLKIKISKRLNVYTQFMLDKLATAGNQAGLGFQAGINWFEPIGIKGLKLQAEFNQVEEGSYASSDTIFSNQSYSHYNQNLAFTINNGREMVLIGNYQLKRWFVDIRFHMQEQFAAAASSEVVLVNARLGYVVNPAYNLNLCLGLVQRKQNFYTFKTFDNHTTYLYLGFRTSIYNLYYDF